MICLVLMRNFFKEHSQQGANGSAFLRSEHPKLA